MFDVVLNTSLKAMTEFIVYKYSGDWWKIMHVMFTVNKVTEQINFLSSFSTSNICETDPVTEY